MTSASVLLLLLFIILLVRESAALRCHVNIGNEKYIPNKYDVEECPADSEFCFTQETNSTGYRGAPSLTRIYGCDTGFRKYCRYGRGCFWMSYSQLTCCCPNDACNDRFNGSQKSDLPLLLVLSLFVTKVIL